MMKKTALIGFLGLLLVATAWAVGPERQKVEKSVTINAPIDKVWALVGDFGNLQAWHPAVKTTELSDDGKERVLTLQDGNTITEHLKGKDDENHTLRYKIDAMSVLESLTFEGHEVERRTLPVDSYTSVIKVNGDDKTTTVSWSGKFSRLGYMGRLPRKVWVLRMR
ncbi:MAG: SRPBCC family protein [Thiolinea sp.]